MSIISPLIQFVPTKYRRIVMQIVQMANYLIWIRCSELVLKSLCKTHSLLKCSTTTVWWLLNCISWTSQTLIVNKSIQFMIETNDDCNLYVWKVSESLLSIENLQRVSYIAKRRSSNRLWDSSGKTFSIPIIKTTETESFGSVGHWVTSDDY